MRPLGLFALFASVVLSSCSTASKMPKEWKTYTSDTGFTVDYPSDWITHSQSADSLTMPGVEIRPNIPHPFDVTDSAYENVWVRTSNSEKTPNQIEQSLADEFPTQQLIHSERTTIDGKEALLATYKNKDTTQLTGIILTTYSPKANGTHVLLYVSYLANNAAYSEELGLHMIRSVTEHIAEVVSQGQVAIAQRQQELIEKYGDILPKFVPPAFGQGETTIHEGERKGEMDLIKIYNCKGGSDLLDQALWINKTSFSGSQEDVKKVIVGSSQDNNMENYTFEAVRIGVNNGWEIILKNDKFSISAFRIAWQTGGFLYEMGAPNGNPECRLSRDQLLKIAATIQ